MRLNVDDCRWRGRPYFAMDLVPATDCKLRLLAAQIELAAGDLSAARSLLETALRGCPRSREVQQEARRIALRIQRRHDAVSGERQ
jgi:uncharacterized protein HemY